MSGEFEMRQLQQITESPTTHAVSGSVNVRKTLNRHYHRIQSGNAMYPRNKASRLLLPVIGIASIIVIAHLALSADPSSVLVPVLLATLLLCGLFLLFVYQGTIRPLQTIEKALGNRNADLLDTLRTSSARFGPLAELMATSFEQQDRLKAEIEERKKTESRLANHRKTYLDLFESMPDAVIMIDTDGTVFLTNRATGRLLNVPDTVQIPVKKLDDLFSDGIPDDIAAYTGTLDNDPVHREISCQVKKYSGELFPARLRFVPFTITTGKRLCLICISDISTEENTRREKERLQDQFEVVYKMEAIGQLAGGMAHEYNNILGAISGYADLIGQQYKSDERLTKYSGMILSASQRASELTRKLLIFARKNRLNLADFNLRDAIEEAIDLLRHTVDKTVTITHNHPDSRVYIYGDVAQFQNAIMNLALNSRDAMPDGGEITIDTMVTEIDRNFAHRKDFSVAPGRYIAIAISDTGCGMNPEVLGHLFEPFYTTKDIGLGTGLGLASVYGTVKSHHGCIDVKSEPGNGTTFTLYFPLVEKTPLDAPGSRFSDAPARGSILFIDDESILRDAVREMLTLIGYTVTTGVDGEDALSLFASDVNRFDLIILDMKMPGISGLECYRKMKELQPEVRVLLSTGYSVEGDRQALLDEGFVGIIQKPYISSELAEAVRAALRDRG